MQHREIQCNIARKTVSQLSLHVPRENRTLVLLSLQWKCICSFSMDCRNSGRVTREASVLLLSVRQWHSLGTPLRIPKRSRIPQDPLA